MTEKIDKRVKSPTGEIRSAKLTVKITPKDRELFYQFAKEQGYTGADLIVKVLRAKKQVSKALSAQQS